jgi:ankyrin repeat protein
MKQEILNRSTISARSIVEAIRSGSSDKQLRREYSIRPDALHYLMRRLVEAGVLTELEMYSRRTLSESDFMMAFAETSEGVLRCLTCGSKVLDEAVGCTQCEKLIEEFSETLIMDAEPTKLSISEAAARRNTARRHTEEDDFSQICRDADAELAEHAWTFGDEVIRPDDAGATLIATDAHEDDRKAPEFREVHTADVARGNTSDPDQPDHAATQRHLKAIPSPEEEVPDPLETAMPVLDSQYVPKDPFASASTQREVLQIDATMPEAKVDKDRGEAHALLKAASRGDLAKVTHLLDQGSDVNLCSMYGNTLLMRAAFKGHVPLVRLLIERGAEVNAENASGRSALTYAIRSGHAEVADLLLEHGANILKTQADGCPALMLASLSGNLEMVSSLLRHGAPVDASNKDGDTALLRACDKGYFRIVEALIGAGAAVNVQNRYGNTALMKAALKGHVPTVELLLKAGAFVNLANKYGNTALMKACHGGHVRVAELLLKAGADIGAKDASGWTAVMRARKTGRMDLIDVLEKWQADQVL